MATQIVKCKLAPDGVEKVAALLAEWEKKHGTKLQRFKQLRLGQRKDDPLDVTITFEFADEEALMRFAEDPITLDYFERAQAYVDSDLEYYVLSHVSTR